MRRKGPPALLLCAFQGRGHRNPWELRQDSSQLQRDEEAKGKEGDRATLAPST